MSNPGRLPTLVDFLALCLGEPPLRGLNAHVYEPGFTTLYVRYTRHIVDGEARGPMLDLASVTVLHKSRGTFKKLVRRLHKRYPHLPLHVENVLDPRFQAGLARLGFRNIGPEACPCFFLDPAIETVRPKTVAHHQIQRYEEPPT